VNRQSEAGVANSATFADIRAASTADAPTSAALQQIAAKGGRQWRQ